MDNPIQQALQMLFGSNGKTQTTGLRADLNSPVPASAIVPHPQDFSMLQNALMHGVNGLGNLFANQGNQIPMQLVNPLSVETLRSGGAAGPTSSPTPTPTAIQGAIQQMTPTPTDTLSVPFSGFTTAKVPENLASLIYSSATKAGVDPNVFASLLYTEHGFQTSAGINKNTDGSYDRGIAQINNKAHPDISDAQALDPSFAIPWAAKELAGHVNDFKGDYTKGIAAYNVGEGGASNPNVFNGAGLRYVGKVASGLTPQLIKKLGIQAKSN